MHSCNSYLQYKRDTNALVHWIIQTSRTIPSAPVSDNSSEITVSTLLALSRIIAARVKPVPTTIYKLFQSVIAARSTAYAFYQQIVSENPSPEIEESNARHKAFLDALISAFEALGGEEWVKSRAEAQAAGRQKEDEEDEAIFLNRFEGLRLPEEGEEEEKEEEEEEASKENKPMRPKKGKGKAKAKGKKGKGKGQAPAKMPEPTFKEHPLEAYKLKDDSENAIADMLLAVYCFLKEMIQLRVYIQGLWRRVATNKLNVAVAGAMSNMAIAILKQLQFEIAADFPGYASFDSIIRVVCRGDAETVKGRFHASLHRIGNNEEVTTEVPKIDIDAKECFLINAYRDLEAFITDYRKNRTGKPTKGMLQSLRWDPLLNLSNTSAAERQRWRSAYAINWLYDLVNTYAAPAIQKEFDKATLESLDWSPSGKWQRRTLWGPVDFAGELATMCMKVKSGQPSALIMPHHVFTLQIALDSMAVTRGWMFHPVLGDRIDLPPVQWEKHPALADISTVKLHEERSFFVGAQRYLQMLQRDIIQHQDPNRHQFPLRDIPELLKEIGTGLGNTLLSQELRAIPASRFAPQNPNGLWEYNPFLCGTGLADLLRCLSEYGITAWDKSSAPIGLIHLYNLLKQTGNLVKPIPLFETLITVFGKSVFVGGSPPTNNFYAAFMTGIGVKSELIAVDPMRKRQRRGGEPLRPGIQDLYRRGLRDIRYFYDRSILSLLAEADWIPDKIKDEEIPLATTLGYFRLLKLRDEAKSAGNGNSILSKLADTPLMKRYKAHGYPLDFADVLARDMFSVKNMNRKPLSDEAKAKIWAAVNSEGPPHWTHGDMDDSKSVASFADLGNTEYLSFIELDVEGDIMGTLQPLSGINYLALLAFMMLISDDLLEKTMQLPAAQRWAKQMVGKGPPKTDAASTIISMAMHPSIWAGGDNEVLKKLAEVLEERMGGLELLDFSYWDDVVDNQEEIEKRQRFPDIGTPASSKCQIM